MRKLNWLVALVSLLFGQSAMAVMYEIDWRTVDGAAFVGKSSGTDRLWGTSDDYVDPTTNLYGWSSGSVEINTLTNTPAPGDYFFGVPLFSDFFTGTIQITGEMAPSGFLENHNYTAAEYVQSWDCDPYFCGTSVKNAEGGPFILRDPAISANSGYYDPLSQTGGFAVDMIDLNDNSPLFRPGYPKNSFVLYGDTYTLFNGQNAIDFLGDWGADLITHFDYILTSSALNPNWLGLEVSTYEWYVYDGISTGFAGRSVQTAYFTSEDVREVAAVPEPTTLGLFAAGLAGLGFSARRRKQAH